MTTSFDDMSHKRMIAWLDQANSGAVRAVADRLASAATEISKIGEELKIRPQMVDWKGEGANSFRAWGADLANETLRLGLYSKGVSERLTEAAAAIDLAKAATPRPQGDPEASMKAALSAPNDPDSAGLVRKLTEEREVAAMEMRKLSQTYSHSVDGMSALERPKFPPPPQAIAPDGTGADHDNGHISGGGAAGGSAGAAPSGVAGPPGGGYATPGAGAAAYGQPSVTPSVSNVAPPPVDMEIAGTATLPTSPPSPSATPPGVPGSGKTDGGLLTTPVVLPPGIGGGRPVTPPTRTSAGGKPAGIPRPPMSAGAGHVGAGPIGRPSRDGGIVGGRPVPQSPGRPAGGLPRGTVVGGEGTHAGRGAMGHGAGMGGVGGGGGQSGIVGGRRLAGESGGVVGGRPSQSGGMTGRPFTPGGTGLVRGGATGDGSRGVGQAGRGGAAAPQRARDPRRDESERPDYLVEDEETWQQGGRRVVPPVID